MDLDRISNLCLSISTEWRDIQITYKNKKGREKSVVVPLIITGSNGIYVFLESQIKEDAQEIYQQLEKLMNVRNDGIYIFYYNNKSCTENESYVSAWAYDPVHHELLELEDLYESFDVFYYNHYIPQAELHYYKFNSFSDYFTIQEIEIEKALNIEDDEKRYIRPILSEKKVEYIENKLQEILLSGRKEGKYTYYEDGTMTVNKIVRSPDSWKKPWESYMETKTYDYPCSDEDGDKTFLLTALGGWFGLHKFRERKILQGLFYLLSCGCCCMFYLIDMVAVMTGNYTIINNRYFRSSSGRVEKAQTVTYNRPAKNKKLFILAPVMAMLSFGLLKYVYLPAYEYGGTIVANILQSVYSEEINSESGLENITGLSTEEIEAYLKELENAVETATENPSE